VNKAIAQYQQLNVSSVVDSASPHELVEMLFDGATSRLQKADGCIRHGDIHGRSAAINDAISIFHGLQASLDHKLGGDLAENLDALYSYMQRQLIRANSDNDAVIVAEVLDLVETLRQAWQAISDTSPSVNHA